MGKKLASIICTLVLSFMLSINVYAEPVEELYKLYNIPATSDAPKEISDVLKQYNEAERTAIRSFYASKAYSGTDSQLSKIKEMTQELEEIELQLFSATKLSLQEIVLLEEECTRIKNEVVRLESTCDTFPVRLEVTDINKLPTKEEYDLALDKLAEFKLTKDIGDILTIKSLTKVGEHNTVKTTFVGTGTVVVSNLFDGTVTSVGSNFVEVLSFTNVLIRYSNLTTISANVGDVVKQYTAIGSGTNGYAASMLISTTYCDIAKLWEDKPK